MPLQYTIKYGSGSGTYSTLAYTLNDVQSVSITTGRQWQTDSNVPGSAIVRSRNIAAWTSPPQIGQWLSIKCDTGTKIFPWGGRIADVKIEYGNVPAMDEAIITCEGPLAIYGRTELVAQAFTQKTTTAQANDVAAAAGPVYFTNGGTGQSTASAQTYNGNAGELINEIAMTEIGHLRECVLTSPFGSSAYIPDSPYVVFFRRNYDRSSGYTLSDAPSASTQIKFSEISFNSAAQNYYTKAVIEPLGLATQSTGTGTYSITQSSVDYSTAQALSHAQYLVAQYNTTNSQPIEITTAYSLQTDNSTRQDTFRDFHSLWNCGAGNLITIVFRSTTYYCVVEGVSMAITPDDTVLSLTLSAFDNNNYLILNNAVFGTLGTSVTYPGNKLGF